MLVRLVFLTGRRDLMGVHVNRALTSALAWGVAVVIAALNALLIVNQATG